MGTLSCGLRSMDLPKLWIWNSLVNIFSVTIIKNSSGSKFELMNTLKIK